MELTASRQSASDILDRIGDAYYEVDSDWRVLYWNTAMESRTGYPRSTVVGEDLWERLPELNGTELERNFRAAMERREPVHFQTHFDGVGFDLDLQVYPTSDGLAIYSRDVSPTREEERRLQAVFDNTASFIMLLRPNGFVLEANETITDSLGVPRSEFVGHTLCDFPWPVQYRPKIEEFLAMFERATGGETLRDELRFLNSTVDVSFTPITGENDAVVYVLVEGHDVTPLKRLETDRDRLFELSNDLICVGGNDGYFKQVNASWERVLGWTEKELLSKTWDNFVHPDDIQATIEFSLQSNQNGVESSIKNRYLTKDGGFRWLSWNVVTDHEQGVSYCVARDITDEIEYEQQLVRQRDRFERVQSIANIGSWEINVNAGEIIWTDEVYRIHGVTPEEYTPTLESAAEFIHPDDRSKAQSVFENALAAGESYSVDLRIVRPDGETVWVRVKGDVVAPAEEDSAPLFRGTIHDITEQQLYQRQLEESEAYLRELYEVSSATLPFEEKVKSLLTVGTHRFGLDLGIFAHIDGDTYRVESCFSTAGNDLERSVFDLCETFCKHTLEATDVVAFEEASSQLGQEHPAYAQFGLETYLGAPLVVDGDIYGTINFTSESARDRPFTESERVYVKLLAEWMSYELQKRKREDDLARSELYLRRIIDTVPEPIFVKDSQGRYELVNEAVGEIFGMSPEEVVGKTDHELMPQEIADRISMDDRYVLRTGEDLNIPADRVQLRDGSMRTYQTQKIAFGDGTSSNSESDHILGVAVDITEVQRTAHRLERSNEELERKTAELEVRFSQLEFFDGLLRHDVLNGLTVIRGNSEVILDLVEDEFVNGRIQTIIDWSDDVTLLVHRVREVIDVLVSGVTETKAIDVSKALSSELTRLENTYPEISLSLDADPGVQVDADDLLPEVLGNILTNAVAHNDTTAPVIDVCVEPDGDRVRITIADNGPGVAPDRKETIFRRGETSHVKRSGAGFGLFFVDAMVSAYGGTIHVEDNDPRGARFVVCLPLAD